MTSLFNKFRVNVEDANDGVWIDFKENPNSDGSVPGFKLRMIGAQNKKYSEMLRSEYIKNSLTEDDAKNKKQSELDGFIEQRKKAVLDTFCSTVLIDWRNFQPLDDGENIEYDIEKAKLLMCSEGEYAALYDELLLQAVDRSNFNTKIKEDAGKN